MLEEKLSDQIIVNLGQSAKEAAVAIGVDGENEKPLRTVQKIDSYVLKKQEAHASCVDIWTEVCLPVGSLWGAQLVREFEWNWVMIVFPENVGGKAVGVFSPDRSLGIYPFHYIFGCLKNNVSVNIELSFNMLRLDQLNGKAGKDTYTDVMSHVVRLVQC